MNARSELHRLLDIAIESYREINSAAIRKFSPDAFEELESFLLALRDRDRAVARPVILRTLDTIICSSVQSDAIREEAAKYPGEHWDYFQDDTSVVRSLISGLFDTVIAIQIASALALGSMGNAAKSAIDPPTIVRNKSNDAILSSTITDSLKRIKDQSRL